MHYKDIVVCGLFYIVVSILDYIVLTVWLVSDEFERIWIEVIMT